MVIVLDKSKPDDATAFEIMFRGLMHWGNSPYNLQKGSNIIRREARILEAFYAISEPCNCGRKIFGDESDRELKEGPQELKFEKGEDFDHVVHSIENAPWGTGQVTFNVLKVLRWLRQLEYA